MDDTQRDRELNSASTRGTFVALQWIVLLRNTNFGDNCPQILVRAG